MVAAKRTRPPAGDVHYVDQALDIFSNPPETQLYVDSEYREYKPVNTISNSSFLEFISMGKGSPVYRDLRNIYTRGFYKITDKTGGEVDESYIMTIINGGTASLIESVNMFWNDTNVTPEATNFDTTSYTQTVLNFDTATAADRLLAECTAPDTGDTPEKNDANNTGAAARYKITKKGQVFEIFQKLLVDISTCDRLIPDGIDIRLRLNLYRDSNRYLFASKALTGGATVKLDIVDFSLYMQDVTLSPSLLLAHARMFAHNRCILPFKKITTREFVIPANQTTFSIENVYLGPKVPTFLLIFFNKNACPITYNPRAFLHLSLQTIGVEVSNKILKYDRLKWDTTDFQYSQAFHGLFRAMGIHHSPESTLVNYNNFSKGYAMFAFDLSRQKSGLQNGPTESHPGPLRVFGTFGTATQVAINCNIFAVQDAMITISNQREVVLLD